MNPFGVGGQGFMALASCFALAPCGCSWAVGSRAWRDEVGVYGLFQKTHTKPISTL